MKNLLLPIISLLVITTSCNVSKQVQNSYSWIDVAVIQELEVYTDTSKIVYKDGYSHAWVKTVYMTANVKDAYKNKIRNNLKQSLKLSEGKLDERMKKWDGFSYNISYRVYDCLNKRYKTLEVTDYTADGRAIIKTTPPKNTEKWFDVGMDTMGDYTLFYICDYE